MSYVKCKNCGHYYDFDFFAPNCPNCGTNNADSASKAISHDEIKDPPAFVDSKEVTFPPCQTRLEG